MTNENVNGIIDAECEVKNEVVTPVNTGDVAEDMKKEGEYSYEVKLTFTETVLKALKAIWRFIITPFKFIGSLFSSLFSKNKSTDDDEE